VPSQAAVSKDNDGAFDSQAIIPKLLAFSSVSTERFAVVIVACLDERV
jgi:hypothetical protein